MTPNEEYRGKHPGTEGPVKPRVITPREAALKWMTGEILRGVIQEGDLRMERVTGMTERILRATMIWPEKD